MKLLVLATTALVGMTVLSAPVSAHGWRNKQVCMMSHDHHPHRVCHSVRQRY